MDPRAHMDLIIRRAQDMIGEIVRMEPTRDARIAAVCVGISITMAAKALGVQLGASHSQLLNDVIDEELKALGVPSGAILELHVEEVKTKRVDKQREPFRDAVRIKLAQRENAERDMN